MLYKEEVAENIMQDQTIDNSKRIKPTYQLMSIENLSFNAAVTGSQQSKNIGLNVMGVPMMLLNPSEFEGMNQTEAENTIREIQNAFFSSDIRYEDSVIQKMAKTLLNSSPDVDMACAFPHRSKTNTTPNANVIIMSHPETYTPEHNGFLAHIHFHDGKGNFPGRPEDHFLMTLFHEAAHGLGADELQSEMIAAQEHKKSFGNNALLKFHSDVRAVSHMLNSGYVSISDEGILDIGKLYPWDIVTEIDKVIETPQNTIDLTHRQAVLTYQHGSSARKHHPAGDVGFLLSSRLNDFDSSVQETHKMMRERAKHKDPSQRLRPEHEEVANRFILACKRLSIGAAAYTNSDNPFDIAPEAEEQTRRLGQENLHIRGYHKLLDALGL